MSERRPRYDMQEKKRTAQLHEILYTDLCYRTPSPQSSPKSPYQPRVKNRVIIPPATDLAKPPVDSAFPAIFDAWPNLSHLEKASVFVIVRLRAITTKTKHALAILLSHSPPKILRENEKEEQRHTNKSKPDELEAENSHESQGYPQKWLRI